MNEGGSPTLPGDPRTRTTNPERTVQMTATVPASAKHRNDGDRGNEGWRAAPPEPNPLPVPAPMPPWPGRRPSSGYRGVHRRPGVAARLAARLLGGAR